jgi:hypothetical protein
LRRGETMWTNSLMTMASGSLGRGRPSRLEWRGARAARGSLTAGVEPRVQALEQPRCQRLDPHETP